MQNIADLRKEYSKSSLDLATVDNNPLRQFEIWFEEAVHAEVLEVNAMTLATINEHGRPTARVVLLKGIENGHFLFYTNYQSQKGRDLDKNPACALTFYWAELERQVRIEGLAQRVDAATSDEYFKSRPRGSQIGAWSSPQSTAIQDRSLLEDRVKQIEKRFANAESLPRPNQWGGYAIQPFLLEFWQGRPNRLHDRIHYLFVDGSWKKQRLAP